MARTSPPNPTSPMITVRGSMGRSRKAGSDSRGYPQIDRRLGDANPTGDIEIHVLAMEMESDPLLENGDQ